MKKLLFLDDHKVMDYERGLLTHRGFGWLCAAVRPPLPGQGCQSIMVRQTMLKFGELSVRKVNELKLLASLAQAGTEGRDFRDVEGGEYLGVSW